MVPENNKPAIIAPPRPRQIGSERVTGTRPIMVATEVKAIASNLLDDASAIAGIRGIPIALFWTILSTIRIEFLTTIPNNAKIPISAGNDSGVLVKPKIIKTPEIDKGITNMTISARLKDANCKTIVIIIKAKDKIIATKIELTEF